MKKHLFDHFVGAAAHHACVAKCCKTIGAKFSDMCDMSKAVEGELHGANISEACDSLAKEFGKMSASHIEHGEACAKFAELLSTKKSSDDEDLAKLMPSAVSGIAPPADGQQLHRAISRSGAPAIATESTATLEFTKIFGED